MNLSWWLNSAWMWKCRGEAARFSKQTAKVARTQARLLGALLRRNRHTWFGRAHDFAALETPRDFQRAVPLTTYADYEPAIDRIARGEANVLTRDPVLLLEPTSGTSGGEKLIPYTASLRRQFQSAVAVWLADLFAKMPAVRNGRAYWSISPALGPRRRSPAGIPIGFDDDAAYLGALERLALRRLLVAPAGVARLGDIATFRQATLLHLLAARDLSLISVWNPTFLTALLPSFDDDPERWCHDLRKGNAGVRPDPRRADELAGLLRSASDRAELFARLWPRLALISCWADAAAAGPLAEMRSLFPGVTIQPKGLLATEGCVSIPLVDCPAPALAVGSHFFEFLEEDEPGRCRLAHEVERGGRYRVVLTTGGGLYRYQLNDLVEIVGAQRQCPLLRFLGKAEAVSDLVGEKLAEIHVRAVLERVFRELDLSPRFAMLVPVVKRAEAGRYRLYLQGPGLDENVCAGLARALEAGLQENPHYRYAVGLGQLREAEVALLADDTPAESVVAARWHELGRKAGDLKPAVLERWTGWPERFAPLLRQSSAADHTRAARRPSPAGSQ